MEKIMAAFKHLPIVVLIGARQVGKTTLMENIPINKTGLFLNGQDPELAEIFQKFSTLEKYLQINLNPQIDGYLFIDEFQFIPKIYVILFVMKMS
jgi:predicted AAA+ superfamily ATPase